MGSSTTVRMPQPSQEERDLQSEQTQLLRSQRDMLTRQAREQELLAPVLYKQLGISPKYDPQGQLIGYDTFTTPESQAAQQIQREQLTLQQELLGLARSEAQAAPQLQRDQLALQQELLGLARAEAARESDPQLQERRARIDALQSTLLERQLGQLDQEMSPENLARRGRIEDLQLQSLERALQPDPLAQQRQDIEKAFLDRSQAALRGELPVNPALMKQLGDEETLLRETFRRQLGPGYETSSPFMEAMDQFSRRRSDILESSRRGDLTLAEALGLAREEAGIGRQTSAASLSDLLSSQGLRDMGGLASLGDALGNSSLARLTAGGGLGNALGNSSLSRLTAGGQLGNALGASAGSTLGQFLAAASGISNNASGTLGLMGNNAAGNQNALNYYLSNRMGGLQSNMATQANQQQTFGQLLSLGGSGAQGAGAAVGAAFT